MGNFTEIKSKKLTFFYFLFFSSFFNPIER